MRLRPVLVLNEQDLRTLNSVDFKDKLLHRDGDTLSFYNFFHQFTIIGYFELKLRESLPPKNCNRLKEIMRNVELYHTNLVGNVSRISINLPTSSLKSDNTVTVTTVSHCVENYAIVLTLFSIFSRFVHFYFLICPLIIKLCPPHLCF